MSLKKKKENFIEYDVIVDPNEVDNLFPGYFNLKSDFKEMKISSDKKMLEKIALEISMIVNKGTNSNSNILIYEIEFLYTINKIKLEKNNTNKGKSGGCRAICLLDKNYELCFLLHIFSKNKKENLNDREKNNLKKCLNEYSKRT